MKNNPSAFSETSLGARLVLSVNDTILQTKFTVDEHRMARSQFGVGSGAASVEFYIYSPNGKAAADVIASSSSGHRVCVGVVDGQAAFNKFVGQDAHGWGIEPDGYVWHNGAVIAHFTSWTLNDYIGVVLNQVRQTLSFSKNGTHIGTIDLPSESAGPIPYYYAATVSGIPGDLAVWANAGQTPQRYPATGVDGWFHARTGLDPLYLATEPYTCAGDDDTPNQKYQGDIDHAQSVVTLTRGVKFWPWGASAPSQLQRGGQIQFTILDPHHDYDELMELDIRDQIVTISNVYQGEAFSTATPILDAIIDHCEQPTDQTKLLVCNDKLGLLQSQLVRPLFAPNADPAVAGKPWPFSGGICRTYVPPFYKGLTMAAGDEFIAAVGKWRHGGREWGYTIDYTVEPDGRSFTATIAPTAKVTAETTTFGGTFIETDTDILSGDGVFGSTTTGAHGWPLHWTAAGGYFSPDPPNTIFQLTGAAPNKYIHQGQSADTVYRLKHDTLTIDPGESVAFEVIVKNAPYYGPGVDAQNEPIDIPPAQLCFGGVDSNSFQFYIWKRFDIPTPQNYSGPTTGPVTYRGTFTSKDIVTRPLIFGFLCNNMIQGTGNITSVLDVTSIRLVRLPDLAQNVTLDGPGLDAMLQDLFIDHGPLVDNDYAADGATNIDDRTGYKCGVHVSENETPQVMDVARLVLDSWTADVFLNRSKKVTAVRLFAPEDVDDGVVAGSLVANDFQGYLTPKPDDAENLTTRMSGCKNYDPYSEADFTNVSLDDVPQILRNQLEQRFQWTVTANAVLSPKYQYALSVAAKESQLDREADGQAEITRVCKLYESQRNFYTGAVLAKQGRSFEIGDVWIVTYEAIPTLATGQKLLLVGINEQPSDGIATLTFWGL
jgi:hypothetical protein